MKLKFDASKVPGLGGTEGLSRSEKMVPVKLFTPTSSWTWFILEMNPETRECFGLVCGFEKEFGYFWLDELEAVVGPMGLGVEVDSWWTPKSLEAVMKAESML